ncbi:MAG: radical SAM protein [Bacteroidetes bacterium]|nr:MAG: radical SAM protein [Bacteroidota bacterium]
MGFVSFVLSDRTLKNEDNMAPERNSPYRKRFIKNYRRFFFDAWRISRFNPSMGSYWFRVLLRQLRMVRRRRAAESEGMMIPPVLVYSITGRCNLKCRGCYASCRPGIEFRELPVERIRTLFREASDAGVGIILIAGGEPLMRPEVLDAAGAQRDILFPVITNGTLMNRTGTGYFRRYRNLVPVLSLEGNRQFTDHRRGEGIYARIEKCMLELQQSTQMFGISVTLTRENFNEVIDPVWMHEQHARGCSLFFLVEYVPQTVEDMVLCLTTEQQEILKRRIREFRRHLPALFLSLPGDEEQYGGCLAAGRGFLHIDAEGNLEPCPFAPYSDVNIRETGLLEALKSRFMQTIRESHHLLTEARGGCTLWENREWVRQQLVHQTSVQPPDHMPAGFAEEVTTET